MSLTVHDVAIICESAMTEYAKSPRMAQGEVRVVIVERLVEETVERMSSSTGMSRERALLAMAVGWMLAESHFYTSLSGNRGEKPTTLVLNESLAPHALELLDALVGCTGYIHKCWREFSASPACRGLVRRELGEYIMSLAQETQSLRRFYDQKSYVLIPVERFRDMKTKALLFFRVVLGERRAQKLFGDINQALSRAYSYAAASQAARNQKQYVH